MSAESQRHDGGSLIAAQVRVPKSGGMNTTKVNVVRWLKHEGEFVKLREPWSNWKPRK